jgi:hypothetical protein
VGDLMLSWFALTIVGGGLILCAVVVTVVLLLPALRGSRSVAREPGDAEAGRACPSCGADNPVEYAFCDRCGASLRAE